MQSFAFPAHQVSIESNETQCFTYENCLQVKTCRLTPGWRNTAGSFGKKWFQFKEAPYMCNFCWRFRFNSSLKEWRRIELFIEKRVTFCMKIQVSKMFSEAPYMCNFCWRFRHINSSLKEWSRTIWKTNHLLQKYLFQLRHWSKKSRWLFWKESSLIIEINHTNMLFLAV